MNTLNEPVITFGTLYLPNGMSAKCAKCNITLAYGTFTIIAEISGHTCVYALGINKTKKCRRCNKEHKIPNFFAQEEFANQMMKNALKMLYHSEDTSEWGLFEIKELLPITQFVSTAIH